MQCDTNNLAFYGYKVNRFFSKERCSDTRLKNLKVMINQIIEQVTLKDELNVLAKLIHQNL